VGEVNACRILEGKPKRKRQLRWPKSRWENIKINLWKIVWIGRDWIHLAQDRGPVDGSCIHGNELSGST
jgi:hypothetical protein